MICHSKSVYKICTDMIPSHAAPITAALIPAASSKNAPLHQLPHTLPSHSPIAWHEPSDGHHIPLPTKSLLHLPVINCLAAAKAHPTPQSPMVGLAQCNSLTSISSSLTFTREGTTRPSLRISLSFSPLQQHLSAKPGHPTSLSKLPR
jgi:hypothetical protein